MKLDIVISETIFQQSPISTQIFSPNGISLKANAAWETLWGINHDEIKGKYNVLKDPQLAKKGIISYIKRGFTGETVQIPSIRYEPRQTLPHLDDPVDYRYVKAVIYPVKGIDGEILYVVIQHEDITEEVEYENKLKQANLLNKNLIESISDVFIAFDKKWNFTYFNKHAQELLGMKDQSMLGKNAWEMFPNQKGTLMHKKMLEAEKKQQVVTFEIFSTATGKWYLARVYPTTTGTSVFFTDISQKKKNEETLSFQANILGNITESVITTDLDGNITYWNSGAEKLFGYTAKEMLGKSPFKLHPSRFDASYNKGFTDLLAGKKFSGEWIGIRKDKQRIHIFSSRTLLRDMHKQPLGIIAVSTDITKRKIIEEELKSSEERLRLAINAGNIGVWDWDIVNNTINWTDTVYKIHGVMHKTTHFTLDQYMQNVYPEDRLYVKRRIEQALHGELPYQLEFRSYGPNKKVIWIQTSAQVLFDKNKKPLRMLGATIDITTRKQLEKQKDEFIGLASHELKTPVTSIKAFAQVLQKSFTKKGDTISATMLKKMDIQINKLTVLISDLLDVTRIEEGKLAFRKEHFPIQELIEDIAEEVQRTDETHTITLQLLDVPTVFGDRERYGQVIMNLLTNAIKYSPNHTKVQVKSQKQGNLLNISVTDNGIGIPKSRQSHIFKRFYRVSSDKNTYPGLGLGLYISREIVERQGGTLVVTSTPKKGSTFTFTIPLSL